MMSYFRVGWGKQSDKLPFSSPDQEWRESSNSKAQERINEVFDSYGNVDPEKLEHWFLSHQIDPNDPRNSQLINSVSSTNKPAVTYGGGGVGVSGEPKDNGYFRLDQMDDQFAFCSQDQINNNVRFQMIQLRSAKAPDFRNYRMMPAYEKEVPKGILESYAKKLEYRQKDVSGSSDHLRGKNFLYLEQLRNQVAHKFSMAKQQKRRSDIIIEDNIPDISTLFTMLGGMAPEQRPLRPVRQERKKVTLQDLSGQEVKVLLSVVRAFDVPIRHDTDNLAASNVNLGSAAPKEAKVNSFVVARLQNSSARTLGAAGPNPAWNQKIELRFKPTNNDFSSDNMRRVKDYLHLHLFDEIFVNLVDEEAERSTEVHQRIEHRWLGSLSIPFTSIYQNMRIEGTFRLHSPPVLLGYERLGQTFHQFGWRPSTPTDGLLQERTFTYLNIYLTLEPTLNVPEPIRERLECEEDDQIVETCERWTNSVKFSYPHRFINPLVVDVGGRSVLMTRYIRGLSAPADVKQLSDNNSVEESIAWFVSLIPYIPSNSLFPGLGDIWPTCEHLMQELTNTLL